MSAPGDDARRVTAIVPVFNRPGDLALALRDLAACASLPGIDLDAVVVDNASVPPVTCEGTGDLPVTLVRLAVNTGGSGGFSTGIAVAASAEPAPHFLWLVDSDARVEPETLRLLLEALDARPDASIAGPAIADPETGEVHEVGGRVSGRSGRMHPARLDPTGEAFECDYVAACCALVRTDAARQTGAFPPIFLNGDDSVWCMAIARQTRTKVLAVPKARAQHPSFGVASARARYYGARNAFGVVRAAGGGIVPRAARAFYEVARAAKQDLRGTPHLARMHLAGVRDAADGRVTGPGEPPPSHAPDRTPPLPMHAARAALTTLRGSLHAARIALIAPPRVGLPPIDATLRIAPIESITNSGGASSPTSDRRVATSPSRQLSIVVLSYNRREALLETLWQLAQGEATRNAEVIVVDNASSDGSVNAVQQMFPRARTIALDDNVAIAGFNRGVESASGEFVLILDDDARPDHRDLAEAIEVLRERPECGAATFMPIHPRTGAPEWPFVAGMREATTSFPVMGCCNLVRREVWLTLGGYDERMFLYRNDVDLAMRLAAAGVGVAFDPKWTCEHDSPAAARKSNRWFRLATRNWVWLARRHGRGLSKIGGVIMGWAWAHKTAGLHPSAHVAILRGVTEGLCTPPARQPEWIVPDGRAFAGLLRLQLSARTKGDSASSS